MNTRCASTIHVQCTGKFLEQVKAQLVPEFHEVRSTNPEDLVYVKEDLIIPHVSYSIRSM